MRAGYTDAPNRPLTPRMLDVLRLAAEGRTAAETARELLLSEATVWNVRAATLARLNVASIPAAVAAAMRRGELR